MAASGGPHERAYIAPHGLRTLQLDAYKKVVRCFMQGPYDLAKEEALATLRQVLQISNDDHVRVRKEVRAEQQQAQQTKRPSEAVGGASPPSLSVALSSHPAQPQLPQAPKQQTSKAGSRAGAAGTSQRKRLKGDGAKNATNSNRQPASHQQQSPPEINPLVGRKVLRFWPRDGGWFEGIVSDFNITTGEHCIVYDFGLPSETYEWYRVEEAPPSEFQLLEERLDVSHLPGLPQPRQQAVAATPPQAYTHSHQSPHDQRAGAAAAAAPVRQRCNATGGARGLQPAARQKQEQQHLHQNSGVGGAHVRATSSPGQRVALALTRPTLVRDWSSEDEDSEGDEDGNDVEWGPHARTAASVDLSE